MSEHSHLIRVATFHPNPGRRDDVIALCHEVAEQARQIEGCFGIQVCSVREEPEWVGVVSRWENPAGVEKMEAALDRNRERMRGLVSEQPRIYHMTPLG